MMTSLPQNKLNFIRLIYVLKPRATRILRELFINHWFKAFKVAWTEDDAKPFIEEKGKDIYVSSSRRCKKLLRSGRLDLWTLNLLGDVLLKYQFGKSAKPNKRVKTLIRTLLETCAEINSTWEREISSEEFDSAWQIIENVLIKLGDSADQLKELKTEQLHSTEMKFRPENGQSFKQLGNKFYEQEKFADAIMFYTQGIAIERRNIESALLYSNRASAYLKSFETLTFLTQRFEVAKDDLKNAIQLCPSWHKAYHRLALMYEEMKNKQKCAKYLEIALAFDPNNQNIKQKLHDLNLIIRPNPPSFETKFRKLKELYYEFLGRDCMTDWIAKCRLNRWDVWENPQLSEKLFSTVIESGNGSKMTKVAENFVNGLLKRDAKKCVELLEKAVECSLHDPKTSSIAATSLGKMYAKGVGTNVDFKKAVMWYERAVGQGNNGAAWHLGLLYQKGSGVEKNEERALSYLKKGITEYHNSGFILLANYYYECELDPDEALRWHKEADGESSKRVRLSDTHSEMCRCFEEKVRMLKSFVDLNGISRWEKEMGLSGEGMGVKERRWRYVYEKVPNLDKIEEECKDLFGNCVKIGLISCFTVEEVLWKYKYPYKLIELQERAVNGSVTAKRMEKAVVHFGNALKCLKVDSKSLPIRLCLITELSQSLQTEPLVAMWKSGDREKVCLILDELLTEVATIKSSVEIAFYVCYSHFHANESVEMKFFLVKCIEKYPEEEYFSKMLVKTSLFGGEYTRGLQECDKLLERLPGDSELLLNKAKLLQGLKEDPTKVIKAYEDFVFSAPKDHPDVPAAFYEIAICYSELNDCEKVKEYVRKGCEAEEMQLPCFLPYKFRSEDRFKELCRFAERMEDAIPVDEEELPKLVERVESILSFREMPANPDEMVEIEGCLRGKVEETRPPQLAELKFVGLSEIKDVKD